MTPEEFKKLLQRNAEQLRRAYADRWPRMVRKEAVDHFRAGFRKGGFVDANLERWDTTRRQQVPFYGALGKYTPLLSKSNSLMSSIDGKIAPGDVTIFSDAPYARYHNEGATARVTPRMKKFFWAMHAEKKRQLGKDAPETIFWRNMATTKKQTLRIPKRRFLGQSEALSKRIREVIEEDLKRLMGK